MQVFNTSTILTLASVAGTHASPALVRPTPCTSTIGIFAHFTNGPTLTVFPSTVTATASFNCGTCQALAVQTIGGLGPVLIYTATVTATRPTVVTTRVCATASVPFP